VFLSPDKVQCSLKMADRLGTTLMTLKKRIGLNERTPMTELDKSEKSPGPVQDTPWTRIQDQIRNLDRALNTIDGWTDESNHTRGFIVGQIEALKWAAKLWEVP
jgi:hypothetical protein